MIEIKYVCSNGKEYNLVGNRMRPTSGYFHEYEWKPMTTDQEIGADVDRTGKHEVTISGKGIHPECDVDNEFIRKIRASYYLIGALLGKYKRARVALPGGCEIGSRPIDQHIKGFKMLGAEIEIENGMISATAKELRGAHIYMDVVSVGATINVMMAASLAKGNTIIENLSLIHI